MPYRKAEAVEKVIRCAEIYRNELNDKNLLFVCTDKHQRLSYFEVAFHDYSFMHLTGLRPTKLGKGEEVDASDFFYRCIAHKLSPNDIEFSDTGTTEMKLDVLPHIICKNLMANMVGDFKSSRPKLYTEKLAGGIKAYVGFVQDEKSGEYVPNTAMKEDLRLSVSNYARVIATYRKDRSDAFYSEIVYAAKNIDWSKVSYSDEYSYLPKPTSSDAPSSKTEDKRVTNITRAGTQSGDSNKEKTNVSNENEKNKKQEETTEKMSNEVTDKLAQKFDNVKKGVDSIMGGQVLEFKAKTIYNSGIDVGYERGHEDGLEKGREQGIEQGIEQGMKMSAIRMRESGMKTKDISYVLQTDEKKVREWIGEDERSKKRTEQDAR